MTDITVAPIPDRGPPPIDPTGMIGFLRARIDDDFTVLNETVTELGNDGSDGARAFILGDDMEAIEGVSDLPTLAVGIGRAEAEARAKRAIVAACAPTVPRVAAVGTPEAATSALADKTLRHLASTYAGHPDYRKEWRP